MSRAARIALQVVGMAVLFAAVLALNIAYYRWIRTPICPEFPAPPVRPQETP